MPPPIILIHRGDSFYLAHTIAQARSSNPKSRLILLGDRSNSFYLGVEHHRYEDYFEEAREFAKLFTYEYFPTYQYPWILFCHQKYFALRDFVHAQGIDKFLLIDSDALIYEPIGPYFEHYKDAKLTVTAPGQMQTAAAGFALVNDPLIIDELCRTYRRLFSGEATTALHSIKTVSFTEMVGLYQLWQNNLSTVRNNYELEETFVINPSVLEDGRFLHRKGIVATRWLSGIPYLMHLETQRLLKSPILHFHGHAKKQMRQNLRLKGTVVRLQHAINRSISAAAKYPMRLINWLGDRAIFPGI
jgi:hypothetical protein